MSIGGAIRQALDWLPAVFVVALLVAAALLGRELRDRAPEVKYVAGVTVRAGETPVVIGYERLGQKPGPRSAAKRHLLIARAGRGWVVANRSVNRRVLVRTSRVKSRYLQRWPLRVGDRITMAEAQIRVVARDGDRLVLRHQESGRLVTFDGTLQPKGETVYKVCVSALSRLVRRAKWLFRNVSGNSRPEFALFSIGGSVNCADRWMLKALPPKAVTVMWHAGQFWLAPGARRFDVTMSHANGRETSFTELTMPSNGPEGRIERIILGRTVYAVDAGADAFRLTAVANTELWTEDDPKVPFKTRAWVGAGNGPVPWLRSQAWLLLPGVVAVVGVFLLLSWYWSRRRTLGSWWLVRALLALVPSVFGGWVTLLLLRGGGTPDGMIVVGMAWLGWSWATVMMIVTGRLRALAGWIWLTAVFLAAVGVLNMLQLGAGAENTSWLSYVGKHAALLALFGWGVAMACALPDEVWRRVWLWVFNTEGVAALLAAVLVVLMLVQIAVGTEEGIAGIQPVEVTKTAFVLLLAFVGMHFTEIRRRETRAYERSPLMVLLPFLRFIGIFVVVVFSLVLGVRDFSPMVILGLVGLALAWKLGGKQGQWRNAGLWILMRPAVALALLAIVLAGYYGYNNAEALPEGMPQKDRVMVWANPDLHPHSGAQVLGSMDRVGEGGWFGEAAWFGRNGKVMTLPAVQDDFITAFYLYRFGGVAGLVLLAAQSLFLFLMLALSRRAERVTAQGDFREQNAGLVVGYLIFGLAWMQIAHWMIAWSNTLGMLPVMGQPMTWLAAGNSHLLGFALFTLFVATVSAWVLRRAPTA